MCLIGFQRFASMVCREEDKPLVNEAIICAENGARRAAYILVWIACAESLKVRLKTAAIRDNVAGKILGIIEQAEKAHKAIDSLLLDEGKQYGLISDVEHQELLHVLTSRNIFAHPYSQEPTAEQLLAAFESAVRCLLSREITFREGYAKDILSNLKTEKLYIDDNPTAIRRNAERFFNLFDPSIHAWFFRHYVEFLESIFDDPTLGVFWRRGIGIVSFFAQSNPSLFHPEEWHDLILKFPKVLSNIASAEQVFPFLGENAQDTLIGTILNTDDSHNPIHRLEHLSRSKLLTKRQFDRFQNAIVRFPLRKLQGSLLSLACLCQRLVRDLSSLDWHQQNPAIDCLRERSNELQDLPPNLQERLGRNVFQAAEGESFQAVAFMRSISTNPKSFPVPFLLGIVLEVFTNETNRFRCKLKQCRVVGALLNNLTTESRRSILVIVQNALDNSQAKSSIVRCAPIADVEKLLASSNWPTDVSINFNHPKDKNGMLAIQSCPEEFSLFSCP